MILPIKCPLYRYILIYITLFPAFLSAGELDHTIELGLHYQSTRFNRAIFDQGDPESPDQEENLFGPEVDHGLTLYLPGGNLSINHSFHLYNTTNYSDLNNRLTITGYPLFTEHYALPITLMVEHGSPEELSLTNYLFLTTQIALLKQQTESLSLSIDLLWSHQRPDHSSIDHLAGDQFTLQLGFLQQQHGFIKQFSANIGATLFHLSREHYTAPLDDPLLFSDRIDIEHTGDRYRIGGGITLEYKGYRLKNTFSYQLIRWFNPVEIKYFDPVLQEYTMNHTLYRIDHRVQGRITLSRKLTPQFTLSLEGSALLRWSNFTYHLKELFSQNHYSATLSLIYENSYF